MSQGMHLCFIREDSSAMWHAPAGRGGMQRLRLLLGPTGFRNSLAVGFSCLPSWTLRFP